MVLNACTYIRLTSSFKSFSSLNLATSSKNFISYEKEGGFQSGANDGTMSSSKNGTHFWARRRAAGRGGGRGALPGCPRWGGLPSLGSSLLDSYNYIYL